MGDPTIQEGELQQEQAHVFSNYLIFPSYAGHPGTAHGNACSHRFLSLCHSPHVASFQELIVVSPRPNPSSSFSYPISYSTHNVHTTPCMPRLKTTSTTAAPAAAGAPWRRCMRHRTGRMAAALVRMAVVKAARSRALSSSWIHSQSEPPTTLAAGSRRRRPKAPLRQTESPHQMTAEEGSVSQASNGRRPPHFARLPEALDRDNNKQAQPVAGRCLCRIDLSIPEPTPARPQQCNYAPYHTDFSPRAGRVSLWCWQRENVGKA